MAKRVSTEEDAVVVGHNVQALNDLAEVIHAYNKKVWYGKGKKYKNRNIGEMLALVHSEVSEALEGYRKDLMDDHLPGYPMVMVEIADAVIRLLDLAGYLNGIGVTQAQIGDVLGDKFEYNMHRADHKPENRAKKGGKRF